MEPAQTRDESMHAAEGRAEELARAVEALVFATNEPVAADQIAEVFAEITHEARPSPEQIQQTVDRLNASYEQEGRALRIRAWAGGFRMSTTEEVAPYLKAFFRHDRQRRLTRSLMETLAILTYKQPATKPEIDYVRGVDSDYALRRLLDIGLIDIVGRSQSVGRPLLYGTTSHFLEAFGLSDLDDLPNLREIEELLNDPSFNKERARLLMLQGLDTPPPSEAQDGET
ncbi:MAG: SMC-Scp complex subunit ScpB [Rhodothermales bacterium]